LIAGHGSGDPAEGHGAVLRAPVPTRTIKQWRRSDGRRRQSRLPGIGRNKNRTPPRHHPPVEGRG
jgi:hypothetical protein